MSPRSINHEYHIPHAHEDSLPSVHPDVHIKIAIEVGDVLRTHRDKVLAKLPPFRQPAKEHQRLLTMEGSIGGLLWGEIPGQVWDFHHEYVNGHHEWILTRWDAQNMRHAFIIQRYVMKDGQPVRKVISYNQTTTSTHLSPLDSRDDAGELETLASAAQRYLDLVTERIYSKK